jgi:hypothetical protein
MTRHAAVLLAALVALPAAAAPPARQTFDRVTYTPPEGWKVDLSNPALAAISRATPKSYCLVAIYASTRASGDLAASCAAEWTAVALRSIDPVAAPKPQEATIGNGRALVGGAPATIKGAPTAAILMVLDAGASVVSILILTSSTAAFEAYSGEVTAMLGSITVRRDETGAPPAAPATPAPGAGDTVKLVVPPPTRQLTIADLVGEWRHEDRISTTYVDRTTGAYAGSDNLAMRTGWTITAKGVVSEHFFAIRNGKKIVDEQVGTIKVLPGNILEVKIGSGPQYLIRGWVQLPAMSVMRLCGPFYEGGVPQDILADPGKGVNLEQHWVRLAKKPE